MNRNIEWGKVAIVAVAVVAFVLSVFTAYSVSDTVDDASQVIEAMLPMIEQLGVDAEQVEALQVQWEEIKPLVQDIEEFGAAFAGALEDLDAIEAQGVTNFDSLTLSQDLVVGDDATVTDDLLVSGDHTVTGATSHTGLLNADGGIAVDTSAFTVASSSGDAVISGTLAIGGATTASGLVNANAGIAVDTSAFTVASSSGNTVVSGTFAANGGIAVDSTAFIVADVTGATTIAGALAANGGIAVDTSAFTVADVTGNTVVAGSFAANGGISVDTNAFTVASSSGDTDISGTLQVDGAATVDGLANLDAGIAVDTSAFTVADVTGNTVVAGSFAANGGITVDSTAFTVASSSGDTTVSGTFAVDGVSNLDDVDIDLSAALNIDGHMVDIGGGTYATADGDNDLGVAADLEVDGATDLDGTLSVAGVVSLASDVRLDASGGNANDKNQYTGLPKIVPWAGAAGSDGSITVDAIDTDPTEWVEVDGGSNIVVSVDTAIYRHTTNSVKVIVSTAVEDEGVDGAIAQTDLTAYESVGLWIYSTVAVTAADLDLTLDDTDGTDQIYTLPELAAETWTWVELDISACNANCDTTDGIHVLITAQSAAYGTFAPTFYLDGMYVWDADDEEALGQSILNDGVLGLFGIVTATGGNRTPVVLVEYTSWFTHYETGSDFIVWLDNQSGNSTWGWLAIE